MILSPKPLMFKLTFGSVFYLQKKKKKKNALAIQHRCEMEVLAGWLEKVNLFVRILAGIGK